MQRLIVIFFTAGLALALGHAWAGEGMPPLPVMKGVSAQSDARQDPKSGVFTYLYTATNGAESAGNVAIVFLDGMAADDMQVPPSWIWGTRQDSTLLVSYSGMGPGKPEGSILTPGGQMQFSLTSAGLPVIGTVRLRADWIPEGDRPEDDAMAALYARLDTPAHVLAPGTEKAGSYEHWSRLRDDLASATLFGWLPDAQFAQTVGSELAAARRAFDTQGPHAAEAPLKTLLASLAVSTPAQRTPAAYALLEFNTQALLTQMLAAPATAGAPQRGDAFQMKLDDASDRTAALGYAASFSGRLTDRANDDKPVADYPMSLFVGTGPDENVQVKAKTDADGRFTLAFDGKTHGVDYVVIGKRPYSVTVQLTWAGGPDLVMDGFIAPMLHWRGFGPIYMRDTVANAGNGPAGPSTVRYYASPTQPVDPKTARVVWTRHVPALQPDQVSEAPKEPGTFPADLPPGIYYLTACVTEDSGPPESNLDNNCESDNGPGMHMMIAVPAMTTREHP